MIFGKREATKDGQEERFRIQMRYHNVFATGDGPWVLADILRMLGYWEHDAENPELRQTAIMILDRGGWLHEDNIPAIVDGYIKAGQVNDLQATEKEIGVRRTWSKK